jgi:hypothetical protein
MNCSVFFCVCNLLAARIILSCRFIAIEKSEKAELTSSLAYNILREWQKKQKQMQSWKNASAHLESSKMHSLR